MLGFSAQMIVIAVCAALAARFVRGLAVFGLSVVLVPVLQLAIAPSAAVMIGLISLFLIGRTDLGAYAAMRTAPQFPSVCWRSPLCHLACGL